MSPIDPSTLDTAVPRSLDGRSYPRHLRAYEQLDDVLLPILAREAPATFNDLGIALGNARSRTGLSGWLASAQWRGLVERVESQGDRPWTYTLGPRAATRLPNAA